jgi:light-regulated signal transduction histidine kinase (bacteriophytochrome)
VARILIVDDDTDLLEGQKVYLAIEALDLRVIIQSVITGDGGRIAVQSQPDAGSTFAVSFPKDFA